MIPNSEIVPVILITILGTGFVSFLLIFWREVRREDRNAETPKTLH